MPATVGTLLFVIIPMKQVIRVVLTALVWQILVFAVMFGFFSFCAMSFNISEWSDGFGRFLMFAGSAAIGGFITAIGELIDEDERKKRAKSVKNSDGDRDTYAS